MKKVIWLCSWYPSKVDAFIGDFVQRQAFAASNFVQVEVFHIAFGSLDEVTKTIVNENLQEHIVYMKHVNKIVDYLNYQQAHQEFYNNYLIRNGKPDLVHVQVIMKAGTVALQWLKKHKLPFVVTEHYGIYNLKVQDSFVKRSFWFRYFTKQILKSSSHLICVSSSLAEDIQQFAAIQKIDIISNTVDVSLFYWKEKYKNDKFTFIHVSNLAEVKNPMGILQAIEKLFSIRQDFCVRFIGSSNTEFSALASQKKLLNNCIFIEPIMSYAEVAQANQLADAGLLFSHSESQSCVVLEWLCCGLPVISSAVGGVVELINTSNGVLVEDNNIEALIDAMEEMIHNYTQYNGNEISKKACDTYSYATIGEKINKVYDEVLIK